MQRRHELHDSYYYHSCVIVPEDDVLDADIIGTGFCTRIKRWWKDLFLLSLSSEKSRGFYTSFNAMNIERFRQFRKYPKCIHPMSKFRNFWDLLMLNVFILNKVLFRFSSSFLYDELPITVYFIGALLDLIIIADVYINMMSGYIDFAAKKVILDSRQCLMHFYTKKVFIYLASATPLHWMMFLRFGAKIVSGLCKANRFTCALKIINIFSLLRVYELSCCLNQKHCIGSSVHCLQFLRIMIVGMVTMCQYYDLSEVVMFLIFLRNGYMDKTANISIKAAVKYGESMEIKIPNSKYMSFEAARIFRSLLLFGFGYKGKVFYLDKIVALIAHLLSKIFYAWSFLECYAVINRMVYPKEKLELVRESFLNMIECHQLPDEFRAKVICYFDYKPTALKVTENHNALYKSLPYVLKDEIKLECYMKLVKRIPYFSNWPVPVLEQIVLMLQKEVYLKNDVVSEALFQANGLMIVDIGVLAVYSDKEQGHLIDGDYFGELSLVTDKELGMSSVVSITPCTILILEKIAFRMYMKNHPKLFYEMKYIMKRKFSTVLFDSIDESVRLSDQVDPRST